MNPSILSAVRCALRHLIPPPDILPGEWAEKNVVIPLGKTTVMQCIASYFIDHESKSQIFVLPTEGDTQTFRETKLNPMLDTNPKIKNKLAKPRGREGANNSRLISYSGGWLMFSWAKSPNTLRGRSAPVTHADEVDAMDVTKEHDPDSLLARVEEHPAPVCEVVAWGPGVCAGGAQDHATQSAAVSGTSHAKGGKPERSRS